MGAKNTVVNALPFLLSTRLCRLHIEEGRPESESEPYIKMAYDQWVWFSSWFALKEHEYLKSFQENPHAALVQERPLAKDSDYQDTPHPDWSPGWVWTADQGLVLGALFDLFEMKDKIADYYNRTFKTKIFDASGFDSELREVIQKIAHGVHLGVVGKSDGLFHEFPCVQSFSAAYSNDYFCGRGILARYLDVLKIRDLTGIDFSKSIGATLNALLSKKDEHAHQFSAQFTEEAHDLEYVNQFESLWGSSDKATQWNLIATDSKILDGLSQSVGLDFLGKVISGK